MHAQSLNICRARHLGTRRFGVRSFRKRAASTPVVARAARNAAPRLASPKSAQRPPCRRPVAGLTSPVPDSLLGLGEYSCAMQPKVLRCSRQGKYIEYAATTSVDCKEQRRVRAARSANVRSLIRAFQRWRAWARRPALAVRVSAPPSPRAGRTIRPTSAA